MLFWFGFETGVMFTVGAGVFVLIVLMVAVARARGGSVSPTIPTGTPRAARPSDPPA